MAIGVAFGHLIEIDERNEPSIGAGERLNRPRADAARPDNAEMRLRDGFGALAAVKTGYTAEAAFIVDEVSRWLHDGRILLEAAANDTRHARSCIVGTPQ